MQSIKKLKNIKDKIVLVRVDFNVPIKNNRVTDDFRIKKALPTIEFLIKNKAKVILITHLGKGKESLRPVVVSLNKFVKVRFVKDIFGTKTKKAIASMKSGEVILLENLRSNKGEKGGDKNFAKNLAGLGNVYVNEAFPVSHREDASIVLLPRLLPHYAGLQFSEEIKHLSVAFNNPKHPFLFILGGAKFSTKMPLVKQYLKLADHVFIGGALLDDFLKAKGYEIGESLVDTESYGIEKLLKNKKLILPVDVLVKSGNTLINKKIGEIKKTESILDIGEASIKILEPYIKKSKLILWNGPLGKYESGGAGATQSILKSVAQAKAFSIVGGGDTVALISKLKMEKNFTFVSTGGGATLDFLADGALVGITALR